ncbi:hypothetical protein Gotri_001941, partial [Gossypium trilobum]|nr:hypothetical protein [Gossypium trilobum]
MAVKLDLGKAYDRVSWDFISTSLNAAKILVFLRRVIMLAISSSSMQILWNGVSTQKFKSVRGIYQGYPLSLYLFVLCMEWLGHIIRAEMDIGKREPIRLPRISPAVLHLFFANDLVIFCKAQLDQALLLDSIINQFCEASGHRIGVRKSNIFFSKVTEVDARKAKITELGCEKVIYGKENHFGTIKFNLVYWRWRYCPLLERPLDSRITSIPPSHSDSGSDKVIWARSTLGAFSIPCKKGIGHNNSCSLCGHMFEDLAHVLRDCPFSKDAWMLVLSEQLKQRFFSTSFPDWLLLNLCFHERLQGSGLTWSCLFGLIALRIWKNRNLFIFQNISWVVTEVVKASSCWARQYETHIGGCKRNNLNSNLVNNSDDTWVFLSTDGVVARDSGYAATRGVVRDHNGNWIMGFTRFLGVCSPFEAE